MKMLRSISIRRRKFRSEGCSSESSTRDLEVCCRELGDYQQAYLYASKQLAMQKEREREDAL